MEEYFYKQGDKPLEGYTIKRAAGRGGFGEVYYAVSDAGREVALKAVHNYESIELRGITQCMNLKSPHLVSIFDVRHNQYGKPFVVMEYVSGPSLREILDESPSGIGEQKAAFFLREIAKGLSYLHDCGIVHRDLKPANIFYENGYVKIGDYGLSKAVKQGYNSNQTITVGTVHYMAPEIGAGNYDYSIDIYALGCMLYEMLTGTVPYFGSSPGEILMKHLAAEPDLTGMNETFARVVRKALAKKPQERYQSVREMVEDAFGSEYIQNSVSAFRAEDLSVIAQKVANRAQTTPNPTPTPTPAPVYAEMPKPEQPARHETPAAEPMLEIKPTAKQLYRAKVQHYDKLNLYGRLGGALLPMVFCTVLYMIHAGVFGYVSRGYEVSYVLRSFLFLFIMQTFGWLGLQLANLLVKDVDDQSVRGATKGIMAFLFANLPMFPFYLLNISNSGIFISSLSLVFIAFFEKNNWLSPLRSRRIEPMPVITIATGASILSLVLIVLGLKYINSTTLVYAGMLACGIVIAAQSFAPFIDPADREAFEADKNNYVKPRAASRYEAGIRQQPEWLVHIWRSFSALCVMLMILLFILAGNSRGKDFDVAMSFAWAFVVPLIWSLRLSGKWRNFRSVPANLIKPLLLNISLYFILAGGFALASSGYDELFVVIIPAMIVFWVVLSIPVVALEKLCDAMGIAPIQSRKPKTVVTNSGRKQPDWICHIWRSIAGLFGMLMILLFIVAGNSYGSNGDTALCFAWACLVPFIWSLKLSGKNRIFRSVPANFIKPLILNISLYFSLVGCFGLMSTSDQGFLGALIPGMIIFWVTLCIPVAAVEYVEKQVSHQFTPPPIARPNASSVKSYETGKRNKQTWIAACLCAFPLISVGSGAIMPIFGLHRFYAGRIGSGIVWFFTVGLFGIGQIIDFIMILTGSFTDANGVPVSNWKENTGRPRVNYPEQGKNNMNNNANNTNNNTVSDEVKAAVKEVAGSVRQAVSQVGVSVSAAVKEVKNEVDKHAKPEEYFSRGRSNYGPQYLREPLRPGAALLRLIGGIVLHAGLAILLLYAIDMPKILSSIPELNNEITTQLGSNSWPSVMERMLSLAGTVCLLVGLGLTILGRRFKGTAHVMRVLMGTGAIGLGITIIGDSVNVEQFASAMSAATDTNPLTTLERVINCIANDEMIVSTVFALIGTIILAWPAKRKLQSQTNDMNNQPQN